MKKLSQSDRIDLRAMIEEASRWLGTANASNNSQLDHTVPDCLGAAQAKIHSALTLIKSQDPDQRGKAGSALNKDDEFALLDRTIDWLPNSYLRDILVAERAAIIDAITSDLAFLGLAEMQRLQAEDKSRADETLRKVQQQTTDLQQTVRNLERRAQDARESIIESQRIAQRIVNIK